MTRTANPPHRRRCSALTLMLGGAVALLTGGCSLSPLSEPSNNTRATQTEQFLETFRALPKGKKLYWIGPSSNGYRLHTVSLPGNARSRIEVTYGGHGGVLYVKTYMQSRSPAATGVEMVVIARRVMQTRQLVIVSRWRGGPQPSPAIIAQVVRSLEPVTQAEIARLPENWLADIPRS